MPEFEKEFPVVMLDENMRSSDKFEYTPKPTFIQKIKNLIFRGLVSIRAVTDWVEVKGIDVSKWQGSIDFVQVATEYDFVIIKASDGLTKDPYFDTNWRKALEANLVIGVYHFFRSNIDGEQQARFFLETTKDLRAATKVCLPPMLDLETTDGVTNSVRKPRVFAWLAYVKANWKNPGVYSSPYYWGALMDNASLGDYEGWVAHWTGVSSPSIPVGWKVEKTLTWQYGVAGKYPWCPPSVPGVSGNCDVNRFKFDYDTLLVYSGWEEEPPPPPIDECPADCVSYIQALEQRIADLEETSQEYGGILETLDNKVWNLEETDAIQEGKLTDHEARIIALESGSPPPDPEPPPSDNVKYIVSGEKAVARYFTAVNVSGYPIMKIWEGECCGGRVKYETGEYLYALPGTIRADGGAKYVELVESEKPVGAPRLFILKDDIMIVT